MPSPHSAPYDDFDREIGEHLKGLSVADLAAEWMEPMPDNVRETLRTELTQRGTRMQSLGTPPRYIEPPDYKVPVLPRAAARDAFGFEIPPQPKLHLTPEEQLTLDQAKRECDLGNRRIKTGQLTLIVLFLMTLFLSPYQAYESAAPLLEQSYALEEISPFEITEFEGEPMKASDASKAVATKIAYLLIGSLQACMIFIGLYILSRYDAVVAFGMAILFLLGYVIRDVLLLGNPLGLLSLFWIGLCGFLLSGILGARQVALNEKVVEEIR
jgi:hypothetical protein